MSSCLVAAEYTHVDLPCSEWRKWNTNIGKHTTTTNKRAQRALERSPETEGF